jgi:hypothetical protein
MKFKYLFLSFFRLSQLLTLRMKLDIMYVCICRGGFSPCTATLYGLLYVSYGYSNSRRAYTPGQPASSTYQRTAELTPLAVTRSTSWTENVRNFAQRFPFGTWGSLTCSKSTTRVKQLKVPSEGLCSRIFPSLKIRRPPPGSNPRHSGHEVGTLPLDIK